MNDIFSFKDAYEKIIGILRRYIVMEEKYFIITTLWIMGTYFHKNFRTYPYLYMNASKGSGKTRLLKLIAHLSKNGRVLGLPSEAFLFREAETNTFCLDEMEDIGRKESHELRLLLNSAYKQGLFVPRMKKIKEEQVAEMFESYAPVCIANIWGLDDVLQDRCITVMLEKVNDPSVTKKIEAWDRDLDVKDVKAWLSKITPENIKDIPSSVVWCSVESMFLCIERIWNDILDNISIIYTNTTLLQHTHYTTLLHQKDNLFEEAFANLDWLSGKYQIEVTSEALKFFKMIYESNIDGRNLELFFPLFMIAALVSEETYESIIKIAGGEIEERSMDDIIENRDTMVVYALYNLIQEKPEETWFKISEVKVEMLEAVGEEKEMKDGTTRKVAPFWLDMRWIGKSIKRAKVIKLKRRMSSGVEIQIDFERLKEKARVLGVDQLNKDIQTKLQTKEEKGVPDEEDHKEGA